MKRSLIFVSLAVTGLGIPAFATGLADEALTIPLPGGAPKIERSFGAQPLAFEPNLGQTAAQVKFLARGKGYQLFLTATEAVMALSSPVADEGGKSRRDGGAWQDAKTLWGGFGGRGGGKFPGLANPFQSGAGAPRSTTLARDSGPAVPPPGLGVRQTPDPDGRMMEETDSQDGGFGVFFVPG